VVDDFLYNENMFDLSSWKVCISHTKNS
jgi:hypothetical protein